MIDWLARANVEISHKGAEGTDETDKTPLSSVSSVGEAPIRQKPVLLMPGDPADRAAEWSDAETRAFTNRRDRLRRWGWSEPDAEGLAERLVNRDREHDDDRVSCTDCGHYRPSRCGNHGPAGLTVPDVGRDLAGTLQRCHGFSPGRSDKTSGSASLTAATETAAAEASAGGGDA